MVRILQIYSHEKHVWIELIKPKILNLIDQSKCNSGDCEQFSWAAKQNSMRLVYPQNHKF